MGRIEAILALFSQGRRKNKNFSNLAISAALLSSADVHLPNQPILDGVDMLHHAVRKQLPLYIVDDLMGCDGDPTVLFSPKALRFYV